MLKIIKNIFYLLIIIILIDIGFGKIFSAILYNSPDGRYYKLINSFEKSEADILIVGSSQAETNFTPKIFKEKLGLSCWNSGRGGQGLPFFRSIQEATLKRYTPKIVILNFSRVFLLRKPDSDKIGFLKPLYWNHPEIRPMIDNISIYEKYLVYSNMYIYNSTFYYLGRSYLIRGLDGKIEYNGWKPRIGQIQIDRYSNFEYEIDKPINEQAVHELEILLKTFSKSGSKIYIIISPFFLPNKNRTGMDELNMIADKYNAKIFDFYKDTTIINKPQLFKDFRHLNVDGAKLLSNKIADSIKQDMHYSKK